MSVLFFKLWWVAVAVAVLTVIALHFYEKDRAAEKQYRQFQEQTQHFEQERGGFGCVSCSLPRKAH